MRCIAVFILTVAAAMSVDAGDRVFVISAKTGLRLSFRVPAGWVYDSAPRNWPSYQEWGLHREPSDTSGMMVRVDPVSNRLAAAENHECGGSVGTPPKTIARVKVAGQTVTLKITYNPTDEMNQAFGSMTIGNSDIYFEAGDTVGKRLDRAIPAFISFVRSIRIERD
jgi:hypothetical protein